MPDSLILILDVPAVAQWTFWRTSDQLLTVDAVFAAVCRLVQEHETVDVVWCFDDIRSIRKEALPCYKGNRKAANEKRDPDLQERVRHCKRLITQLRDEVLPDFYIHPVWQSGLEADDMVAAACKVFQNKRRLIVSTDADLWQLLDSKTTMYSPSQNKYYSEAWFVREYGIQPKLWSLVKAIAGCASDNVPGVAGVGEISAVKYILGTLTGKKFNDIEANTDLVMFNKSLVKLPHKSTMPIEPFISHTTESAWYTGCKKWDIGIWAENLGDNIPNYDGTPF